MGYDNIPMEIYTFWVAVPRIRAKYSPSRFSQDHSAADVVEEYLYGWGLPYELDPNEQPPEKTQNSSNDGKQLSPMICR